jgi:hypothetical protein
LVSRRRSSNLIARILAVDLMHLVDVDAAACTHGYEDFAPPTTASLGESPANQGLDAILAVLAAVDVRLLRVIESDSAGGAHVTTESASNTSRPKINIPRSGRFKDRGRLVQAAAKPTRRVRAGTFMLHMA